MAIHLTGINSYMIYRYKYYYMSLIVDGYRLHYHSIFFVIVIIHLPWHSEIGHFDDSVIGQKDIAGGQIAVQNLYRYGNLD
jgi:hypothetical protein